MSLPSINFPHLMVSKIHPGQDFISQGHYSKVKSRSRHDIAHQRPYHVSTSYILWFARYSLDKILWVKVTTARSKVESRSHYDIAHLQPLTNVPTKYQLPTPYGFQDIAQKRFYTSRSLRKGQRSNQGHTITLHTYTP